MAAGGTSLEIPLDNLQCQVCSCNVVDPRNLPCGHWFCGPFRSCLTSMIRDNGNVECIACKQIFRNLDINALEVNERVLSKLHFENLTTKLNSIILDGYSCNEHITSILSYFCENCSVKLCNICWHKHNGSHKVIHINEKRKQLLVALLETVQRKRQLEKYQKLTNNVENLKNSLEEVSGFCEKFSEDVNASVAALQNCEKQFHTLTAKSSNMDAKHMKEFFNDISGHVERSSNQTVRSSLADLKENSRLKMGEVLDEMKHMDAHDRKNQPHSIHGNEPEKLFHDKEEAVSKPFTKQPLKRSEDPQVTAQPLMNKRNSECSLDNLIHLKSHLTLRSYTPKQRPPQLQHIAVNAQNPWDEIKNEIKDVILDLSVDASTFTSLAPYLVSRLIVSGSFTKVICDYLSFTILEWGIVCETFRFNGAKLINYILSHPNISISSKNVFLTSVVDGCYDKLCKLISYSSNDNKEELQGLILYLGELFVNIRCANFYSSCRLTTNSRIELFLQLLLSSFLIILEKADSVKLLETVGKTLKLIGHAIDEKPVSHSADDKRKLEKLFQRLQETIDAESSPDAIKSLYGRVLQLRSKNWTSEPIVTNHAEDISFSDVPTFYLQDGTVIPASEADYLANDAEEEISFLSGLGSSRSSSHGNPYESYRFSPMVHILNDEEEEAFNQFEAQKRREEMSRALLFDRL